MIDSRGLTFCSYPCLKIENYCCIMICFVNECAIKTKYKQVIKALLYNKKRLFERQKQTRQIKREQFSGLEIGRIRLNSGSAKGRTGYDPSGT